MNTLEVKNAIVNDINTAEDSHLLYFVNIYRNNFRRTLKPPHTPARNYAPHAPTFPHSYER